MASKPFVLKRIVPSVSLQLKVKYADKTEEVLQFKLSYPFASLSAIESKLPVNMMKPGELFSMMSGDGKSGTTALAVAFWAGLLFDHPEFGTDPNGFAVAQSYLSFDNSGEVSDAVLEALILALPEETTIALREALAAVKAGQAAPAPKESAVPLAPAVAQTSV